MNKCNDLTGKTYGLLYVDGFVGSEWHSGRKRRMYQVTCQCGNTKKIPGDYLSRQMNISCGCMRRRRGSQNPKWRGCGEISGAVWDHIKREDRGLDFDITIEFAWDLFLKQNRQCALSGLPLVFDYKSNRTASSDRIDSGKGYLESNVQWVHKNINLMKLDHNQDDFISLCLAVADYQRNVVNGN